MQKRKLGMKALHKEMFFYS